MDFNRSDKPLDVNCVDLYNYSLDVVTSVKGKVVYRTSQAQLNLNLGARKHRKNQISHLSVVVEASSVYNLKRSQLSYCGQDCRRIPSTLGKMYANKVQCLDLSYNSLVTLQGLEVFNDLEELILDNNQLGDAIYIPSLKKLNTLSLNNNQIVDLEKLVKNISVNLPSLTYLSLLSNRACPNQLSDKEKDDTDYQRYRYYVLHHIPKLKFLDSRKVYSKERREAATRGHLMTVRRPKTDAIVPLTTCASYSKTYVTTMPASASNVGTHKGAYGKCNYKYTGKHSEGNRFILNSDL